VNFVPILQKCMQSRERAPLACAASLRALFILCDCGVLDPGKTLKIVLNNFEGAMAGKLDMQRAVQSAFLHFLGSAQAAFGQKKYASFARNSVSVLRNVLVAGDSADPLVVRSAADALLNFDAEKILDFLGDPGEDEDQDKFDARNTECLYNWTRTMLSNLREGSVHDVHELLLKLAKYEWSHRQRSQWSELRILKLATAALKQSRQGPQTSSGVVDKFGLAARELPISCIRALVERSALSPRGDEAAGVSLKVLKSAEALVAGLPWAELLFTTSRVPGQREDVLQSAIEASFNLGSELEDAILPAFLSQMSSYTHGIADSIAKGIIQKDKADLAAQLLEEYTRRDRIGNLCEIACNVEAAPVFVHRFTHVLLLSSVPITPQVAQKFAPLVERCSDRTVLSQAVQHQDRLKLSCAFILETDLPLTEIVQPILLEVIRNGDNVDSRRQLYEIFGVINCLPLSRQQEVDNLEAEIRETIRPETGWLNLLLSGLSAARLHMFELCSDLEDATYVT